MTNSEYEPRHSIRQETTEFNYAALYAHGLVSEILSSQNGIIDVFERELFPGFIDERETEFVGANHVRFLRNGDDFIALFEDNDKHELYQDEDTEKHEFYQRDGYIISLNGIAVFHDTRDYDDKDRAIIAHSKQAFKDWAETLNAEDPHAFYSIDEGKRLVQDLIAYERLKQEQDRYFALMTGWNLTDDVIRHGEDAGKQYEKIRKDINSLGVSVDSNHGTRYENSYRELLHASMKSIDMVKKIRQKSDAELYDRLVEGTTDLGVPIGGFELSSLIRVIEKVRSLPSKDQN